MTSDARRTDSLRRSMMEKSPFGFHLRFILLRIEAQPIIKGVGRIFPREWEPDELRNRPLVDAYADLLFDPDPCTSSRRHRVVRSGRSPRIACS